MPKSEHGPNYTNQNVWQGFVRGAKHPIGIADTVENITHEQKVPGVGFGDATQALVEQIDAAKGITAILDAKQKS